jgi:hypothetical protein
MCIWTIIFAIACIGWCLQSQEIAAKRRQNEAEDRAAAARRNAIIHQGLPGDRLRSAS